MIAMNKYTVTHPWKRSVLTAWSDDPNNLYQCKACMQYYDIHRLISLAGHWVCDVCLSDLEVNGVHDVQASKK